MVVPVFTPDNPGHRPRKFQTRRWKRDHVVVRRRNVIFALSVDGNAYPYPLQLFFQSDPRAPLPFSSYDEWNSVDIEEGGVTRF